MTAPHPHRYSLRVHFEDTDAGGVVYHSRYLNFAERARSEFVRELGIDQPALLAGGDGHAFAVRRAEIDFIKPARLGDVLEVESVLTQVGGASLDTRQVIRRSSDGGDIARLSVSIAFISLKGGPARFPRPIREVLRNYLNEGH